MTAAHPGVTAKFGVITLTGHVETFFENSAAEQATLARHGDLPMTGMPLHDASDPTRAADGDLAMQCGRPVLVARQALATPSRDHVMVARKDTREGRSTALGALSLLKRATHVTVVGVADSQDVVAARQRLTDVSRSLAGHSITAELIAAASSDGDEGRPERLARDSRANLIVARAYGHHRLRERAFGGVTRTLLQSGDRCAMLSH